MKKLIFLFLVVAQSCMADFFVQYDNSGNIIATVWSDHAPIIKNGLNQLSFDKPIETMGKLIDITKTTKDPKTGKDVQDKKYEVSKDQANIVKVNPNFVYSND